MLISASTLVSRTLRKRRPLLLVPVTVIAEAAAVVRAATVCGLPVMLEINTLEPLTYDLTAFLGSVLMIAREDEKSQVCVGVRVAPSEAAVTQALDAGAQFVRVEPLFSSAAQYQSLVSDASRLAAAQGAAAVFTVAGMNHLEDASRLTRQYDSPFVIVPKAFLHQREVLNARLAADIQHALATPLALQSDGILSPKEIRLAARAGVGVIILTEEMSQAFVAGLRAALSNEHEGSASHVVSKAALAVEERITRYLEVLCTIS